ncbi:MAG TPA: hypothetical protein VK783_14925 [Bacteroidia bacterium]|jgi:hypothetical protein|nr:hypothetical protein [Bacteroidia bacterium]
MKFPTKNTKMANTNSGGPTNFSMKEFREDLPPKTRNTIREINLNLINEAIAAITNGDAKINGKSPKTHTERHIVVASYFKTAKISMNMFFDGVVNVKDDTVMFKFKDQPFTIKFPEIE